jgi:beta-lactamase class A
LVAPTARFGARWSISLRRGNDLEACASYCPVDLLRTASVAKIFVLMLLARRLADGRLSPDRLVDRRRVDEVLDSGLWHTMRADSLPVADVAVLIGAVSDNWATNVALDLCGLDTVQGLARAVAPGGSMLNDYVRMDRPADVPSTLSVGCAQDWVEIMHGLHAERSTVLDWLAHDADLSMVAGAFDLDPLAHDVDDLGLRLWHKTGTDDGVRADVGVVASAGATVTYAVLCNWPEDGAVARRAVLTTMRAIGDEIRALL